MEIDSTSRVLYSEDEIIRNGLQLLYADVLKHNGVANIVRTKENVYDIMVRSHHGRLVNIYRLAPEEYWNRGPILCKV